MPQVDLSFAQDPNTLALALLCGIAPAAAWLFFWLRESAGRPRDGATLSTAFIGGAVMVALALPVETFIGRLPAGESTLTVLWAAAEEVLKFAVFALLFLRSRSKIAAPLDYPLYMIVVALGFAGFENALYFLQPLQAGNTGVLVLAGTMRYLGTTLMHAAAASLPAIAIALACFKPRRVRAVWALVGLCAGMALHGAFNLFIVRESGLDFFRVFGFLWLATVGILLLLELVRQRGSPETVAAAHAVVLSETDGLLASLLAASGQRPDDDAPIAAALSAKGLVPAAGTYGELDRFIDALRGRYVAYLVRFGADEATAGNTARTLIPATISPKTAKGIMEVLSREEARPSPDMPAAI